MSYLIPSMLLSFILILLVKYYLDRKRKQEFFAVQNISGPNPSFLWGNFGDLRRGARIVLNEWAQKYGETFCYFEGDRAILVTADLDIIKQVLIKDFSNFHSRSFSPFFTPNDGLVHAKGNTWKRLRRIVSPTFSASRMKEMSPLVNKCVDGLIQVFDERAKVGKVFDIMADFQGLTLTTIACCAFGIEVDAMKDPNNIFLVKCKEAFDFDKIMKRPAYFKLFAAVGLLFPQLAPIIRYLLPGMMVAHREWFYNVSATIIESRKNDKTKRNDFIQLLLNAEQCDDDYTTTDLSSLAVSVENDNTVEETNKVNGETMRKKAGSVNSDKTMTLNEMQAQCMIFLLAGYETTSTALSFVAYELAINPDVQKKLQREVDEYFSGGKVPDYVSIQGMAYMDMVFSEALRLYSIAELVTVRECVNDCKIKGVSIPRGTVVKVHMDAIHKSIDHWGPEDTDKFVPERFSPERKAARNPLAWQPFGSGPRNCVGMRFALMEAKITLARMLQNFDICKTEETQVPLKITKMGVFRPSEGVLVKLQKRASGDL